MNKQEVINEIEKIDYQNLKYDSPERMLSEQKQLIIDIIERLDQPQKVKVPKLVAEWIELCKEKADLSSCLNGYYEIGDGTIVRPRGLSETFYDWLSDYDHMHDLARAYLDGYEVEEAKWIVRIGKIYLTGNQNYSFCREDATVFEIEKFAEEAAEKTGGFVDKVERQ